MVKHRQRCEERGASAVEYAMMVAAIAVVLVIAVAAFGHKLAEVFSGLGTTL